MRTIVFAASTMIAAATPLVAQRGLGPRQVDSLPSSTPMLVERYGADSLQFGELRLPKGAGPFPVAVVIHGGCWTAGFATFRNTAPLASALTEKGVATWNIEYRQAGNPGGGWPGSYQDWGAGVDHLRTLADRHQLDLSRVMVIGHSAGATAAVWTAARPRLPASSAIRGANPLAVAGAVGIDGPMDLASFVGPDARICGRPVVAPFLGGTPAEHPVRYREGAPLPLLPIGARTYVVASAVMSPDAAKSYQDAARAVGDSVGTLLVPTGGHFNVIAPSTSEWMSVEKFILDAFARARPAPIRP